MYSSMYLIPRGIFDILIERSDSGVKEAISEINIKQLNNVEVNHPSKINFRATEPSSSLAISPDKQKPPAPAHISDNPPRMPEKTTQTNNTFQDATGQTDNDASPQPSKSNVQTNTDFTNKSDAQMNTDFDRIFQAAKTSQTDQSSSLSEGTQTIINPNNSRSGGTQTDEIFNEKITNSRSGGVGVGTQTNNNIEVRRNAGGTQTDNLKFNSKSGGTQTDNIKPKSTLKPNSKSGGTQTGNIKPKASPNLKTLLKMPERAKKRKRNTESTSGSELDIKKPKIQSPEQKKSENIIRNMKIIKNKPTPRSGGTMVKVKPAMWISLDQHDKNSHKKKNLAKKILQRPSSEIRSSPDKKEKYVSKYKLRSGKIRETPFSTPSSWLQNSPPKLSKPKKELNDLMKTLPKLNTKSSLKPASKNVKKRKTPPEGEIAPAAKKIGISKVE